MTTNYTLRWREAHPEAYRASAAKSEAKRRAKRRAARELVLGAAERCAICGQADRRLHWDHDHGTGKPRGWLCPSCNTSLGKMGDNPVLLERAAKYLRKRGFLITKAVLR